MNDPRRTISWLLLGLVGAVGLGGAILGIALNPKTASLAKAKANTLTASSYTEVVTQKTLQGSQTDYLVWQAPDRLGGYIESGTRRTYVYVIGSYEYQSVTVSGSSSGRLVFYRQPSQGAAALDPTPDYLAYIDRAKDISKSGTTYSFTVHQGSVAGKFTVVVSGSYVASLDLSVQRQSVGLVLSQIDSSPPVRLPANSRVVGLPTSKS